MSFIKGFIFGTAVGIAIGSAISETQRREFVARVTAPAKRQVDPSAAPAERVATFATA
jgi:hypothetical protein